MWDNALEDSRAVPPQWVGRSEVVTTQHSFIAGQVQVLASPPGVQIARNALEHLQDAFLIKKLILLAHCVWVEVHQDPRSTLECGATSLEQASKPPDGLPNQGGLMGQTVAQGHFFTRLTHGSIGLSRNTLGRL